MVLSGGVTFTFPRPTVVPAGEFVVLAASPQTLETTHGLDPGSVKGPYEGSLSNDGERLELWTAGGYLASYIEYSDASPWPETPDGMGPTLERISPLREEGDAEAWAASIPVGGTPGAPNSVRVSDPAPPSSSTVFVADGATWRYLKGRAEPPASWTSAAFDDGAWDSGPSGFGYDDGDDATVLTDMRGGYTSLYIRKTFQLADPSRVESLVLGMLDRRWVRRVPERHGDRPVQRGRLPGYPARVRRAGDRHPGAPGPPRGGRLARARLAHPRRERHRGARAERDDRQPGLFPGAVAQGLRLGRLRHAGDVHHLADDDWRFLRGTAAPPAAWRDLSYVDDAWETGQSGFGYGDGDDATVLDDMEGNYLTVFVRKRFRVTDVSKVTSLLLEVDYDDGFIAYLNGTEVARANVEEAGHDRPATDAHEASGPEQFVVPAPQSVLRSGINVLAIEGHDDDLASSDLSLIPSLVARIFRMTWRLRRILPPRGLRGTSSSTRSSRTPPATGGWSSTTPRASPWPWEASASTCSRGPPGTGRSPPGPRSARGSVSSSARPSSASAMSSAVVLVLSTPEGYFKDAINPRTASPGLSTGRWPDGFDGRWVFEIPTRNAPNSLQPESRVVIHEVQFHPSDQNLGGEFIELYNLSATDTVDLSGWSFTRGIEYTFEPGTTIGPNGYAVLARDPDAAASFYGIPRPLGPYTGGLRNDAETLLLRDALKNPADRVRYADEGSWPEGADGQGPSVELVNPALENRWGRAWAASTAQGTPGAANSRFQADPPPIVVGVEHSPWFPARPTRCASRPRSPTRGASPRRRSPGGPTRSTR